MVKHRIELYREGRSSELRMRWNVGVVGVIFLLISVTLTLCFSSEARNVRFISPSGIRSVELKKERITEELKMNNNEMAKGCHVKKQNQHCTKTGSLTSTATTTTTTPESLFPPIIPPVLPSPPPALGGVPLPPNPFQPPPLLPFPPNPLQPPSPPAFGLPPLIPGLIPSPPPPPPLVPGLPIPLPPVIPGLPPLIPGVPPAT